MKLSTAQFIKENAKKGFTLIELLVVIGILGILAAALVATIDPFEQLQKAEDSRTQNTTVEYQTALTRYYVNHQAMPWEDGACDPVGGGQTDIAASDNITLATSGMQGCTDVMIAEGELKEAFNTALGLENIYIVEPHQNGGDQSSVGICYEPVSKAGQANNNTRYNQDGSLNSSCPDSSGTETCFWCAQ